MENDTDTISQIICNFYKENLECLDNHVLCLPSAIIDGTLSFYCCLSKVGIPAILTLKRHGRVGAQVSGYHESLML